MRSITMPRWCPPSSRNSPDNPAAAPVKKPPRMARRASGTAPAAALTGGQRMGLRGGRESPTTAACRAALRRAAKALPPQHHLRPTINSTPTVLKQIIGQKPQPPPEPSVPVAPVEPAYGSHESHYDQPRKTTAPIRSSAPMSTNKNILSSDVEIKGSLKFSNDLIIDGKIEGEVTSDGSLTVGENAFVQGEIRTKSVVLFGRVQGNITVNERCELKSTAVLEGDVVAGTLAIEEGATFMGKSSVGKSAVAAAQKAKAGGA
jgi:cytoskeletal protein CcmA (bactofilin family)